jgi:hypothetical protein
LILLPHVKSASVHVSTDHLHGSVGSGGCRTARRTRYAHNLVEVHVRESQAARLVMRNDMSARADGVREKGI